MPDLTALEVCRLAPGQVYRALTTSPQGLSQEDVRRRALRYGPNNLQDLRGVPLLGRFARQFTHFLALLLWVAAALAFFADRFNPGQGMATLGWAILGVIIVNALFAFLQEYRAERAVQALRSLLPAKAWVLREGQPQQVPRDDLVPGDLLILEEGEQVSADARLVEAVGLRVDNSPLTGESKPQRRSAEPITDGHPLDIPNLVFAGTTVLSGHGQAVVFATGLQTEFGKIANLATSVRPGLSPLQREIVTVTHMVAALSLMMGIVFFTIGVGMGLGFWTSAIFGIGIIVANVPEGLLPTVTLALAMGSQRMATRKALIKHLTSVETLGCTTVICTDKTGTLTENRMRVDRLYVDDLVVEAREGCLFTRNRLVDATEAERWRPLFDAIIHCNNAKRTRRPDGRSVTTGDPTETALLDFAQDHGLLHRPLLRRMDELPFDADRKRMTTLHWSEGRLLAFTKGAPESVLPLCVAQQRSDGLSDLTVDGRKKVLAQGQTFAQQAYRVLAVAMREVERGVDALTVETVEQQLTFLGLVAMMDPPHREVPEAVSTCRRAGVRVIMITGDHPLTALAIARRIGLAPDAASPAPGGFVPVIEGLQLDRHSDEQLRQLLTPTAPGEADPVFARMAPRHKLRIVAMLKAMGEVVAVTGDGVNDAPALKQADIGIAMGIAGTDVAKETASMILLDDNFSTIVNAIEEGRTVYTNIRKFVTYVLASNVPEVVPYLAFGLSSAPLALTVPQILAVDLGTDMVPALALAAEAPQPGIMNDPPRPKTERLLSRDLLLRAYGFLGMIEAAIAMGGFFLYLFRQGWSWGDPLDWNSALYREATTVTLSGIVVAQVANVFACRSERLSAFRLGWFSNLLILLGVAVEVTLLLLLTYSPLGHMVFGTAPLPAWIFGTLILGAIGLLLAEETRKIAAARLRAFTAMPQPGRPHA
ncbi:MAG: cation-transporting P-type ATPase [Nitrospirales bacterium]|nr:cation-transporting P-type ATPase [Nitrospirales bacterium]RIK60890.1 MAG: ATPase [Nitrospira sp.]